MSSNGVPGAHSGILFIRDILVDDTCSSTGYFCFNAL